MAGPLESGFPSEEAKGRPKCGWQKVLDCPHCTIRLAQELGLSKVPSMRHLAGIPPTQWTTEGTIGAQRLVLEGVNEGLLQVAL